MQVHNSPLPAWIEKPQLVGCLNFFIYKITKKTEKVNWLNLGAESVEDHVINGGHIEVEDCEI